jgi:hypothetical protein
MKQLFTILFLAASSSLLLAQNINYESRITRFYGSNCGNDPGFSTTEEHTWHGYLSDNVNTAETYSGCIQRNTNGAVTQNGTYAVRNQNNVTATQLRARINAYEDDMGARCSYNTGFNSDDCRANQTCTYNFTTPLEYQWTSASPTCGSGDYNMTTFYQYRYTTTTIPAAVENSTFGFTTGGTRGFWGSQGSWANVGSDCATSGTITHNETSSFSTTVNCIDQVTFRWNVSSESGWDFLRFYINGVEQASISGTPGWATRTFNLDPNINNVLEWRYTKDGSVSSNLDRGFVDQITYRNYTIPVAGTSFGANQWNVSCYNGRSIALSGITYRGFYVENNLNISTTAQWASGSTPSNAASYDGCSVNTDNHTFVHKRQGFPCGVYNLNITGHDDEIIIYVNGTQVWNFNGCCTNHGTVWTGYLTSTSTVEIRVGEGGGGSNLTMNLVDVTPALNGGTVAGTQSICSGGDPTNLNSTAAASGGTLAYTGISYQWQFSNNNSTWSNIGGATGLTYNPPSGLTQTRYYRRRIIDACGSTTYSSTATVTANPLPNGNLAGAAPICAGTSGNIQFNATAGTGPWDIVYNSNTLNNIATGTSIPVTPGSTTTYTLSSITDNNGCVRTTGLGTATTVVVNTNSTAPTIAAVTGKQCPNSSLTLMASGGTAGTGSSINWYTGPNGSGTNLGSGNSISVAANATTTYYARRQGTCNTTPDDTEVVEVKDYAYTPTGSTVSVGYCTDNAGWNHFYDANDQIIFSLEGNLTGATTTPVVTINNNGSYYQTTVGAVGSCANGWSPGEEFFELPRSWNVDFAGTLNPPYNLRYYFPASEKTDLETAAANHIAANSACTYTYKYPNPNGFYWFKNVGATYVAPLFDQPTQLSATSGSVGGLNYSEITGVTSFSGGAGAIALSPDRDLPVEFTNFTGWNDNSINVLQWITETELNNERFEIERSIDLQDGFTTIGVVTGAGNSSEVLTYLFEDATPMLGINYYRLRQVDFDGSFTYSKIIAIDVKGSKGAQVFFPNPTLDVVSYQFNTAQKEALNITIIDVLGKTLAETVYQTNLGINTTRISLAEYPAGTYLIKVQDSSGAIIATERIIKKTP